MRIRVVLASLAVVAAGCTSPAPANVTGSLAPTPLPSATATATASTTSTVKPTPEATEPPITADDVVVTTVENLRVRKAPGTESEAIGFLKLGTTAFLLDDPVPIDGVPWYPASGLGVPWLSGCVPSPPDQPIVCPSWRGWIAGANAGGEPWLERTAVTDCPTAEVASILGAGYTYRLICFGDDEITLTAYWPELPPDPGLGGTCRAIEDKVDVAWLMCQFGEINVTARETDNFSNGLRLTVNPQSDAVMPRRGQWLRISGHFDDPAARGCGEVAEGYGDDPIDAVFNCRLEFVPTAISRTTAP